MRSSSARLTYFFFFSDPFVSDSIVLRFFDISALIAFCKKSMIAGLCVYVLQKEEKLQIPNPDIFVDLPAFARIIDTVTLCIRNGHQYRHLLENI